jgi:DNA-binding IclR family transcriptional regulator
MGKVLLSSLPIDTRRRLLTSGPLHKYTDNTITDLNRLEAELETIRKRDFAIDNQEFLAGVVCIATPVRNHGRDVVAAIAISAPIARMSVDSALQKEPLLKAAAERMGATLAAPQEGRSTPKARKKTKAPPSPK